MNGPPTQRRRPGRGGAEVCGGRGTYVDHTRPVRQPPAGPVARPLCKSWQDEIEYMGWPPSDDERARLAWWLVHTASVPERAAICDTYAERFDRHELYQALDRLALFVRLPEDLEEIRRERLMLDGERR